MKNSFIQLAIVVAMTAICSGCSTTLGPAADSWIGAPVDEFVVLAGAPRRKFELQDGRVAYTWVINCEVTFVAREGVFQSWSSTNCARIQPVPGKWKRSAP
jgi:hypothetical protein